MAVTMASQFSDDGKYYAHISTDGKLKIWNTESNSFDQEFTPNFHLTSPCTCLRFVQSNVFLKKGTSPRKKKRRESDTYLSPIIILGTTSGVLLIYSLSKANLEFTINSETNQSISCLSSYENIVYSGADQSIFVWCLQKKKLVSKWKAGNEKISSILAVPDSNQVLTASKNIKLWDADAKEVLRTFTGHSSDVIFLQYVSPLEGGDAYFVSGSKGDRLLNCWNLTDSSKDKNSVASFLMEDIVQGVSIRVSKDGRTNMATAVRSGVVHVYQHTLNGKSGKPLKPKTTVQVVSDTGQTDKLVTPIRIVGAIYKDDETLCIAHGNEVLLTFENITISTHKKSMCLIRKVPKTILATRDEKLMKSVTPIVNDDVMYLTPETSIATAVKRKIEEKTEVPMEQRLENLTLNKLDGSSNVPKNDNVAQLLVQGLHSKDKNIIRSVLGRRDENVIRNTVKRLPINVLINLIEEVNRFIQGKTSASAIGAVWMKHILQVHAGILMSNPDLPNLLGVTLGSIESRLSLAAPLYRLKGRLNLLIPQVSKASEESDEEEEPLLVFNDKDSSDSDAKDFQADANSESDNEWDEESIEDGDDADVNHVEAESDSDAMST